MYKHVFYFNIFVLHLIKFFKMMKIFNLVKKKKEESNDFMNVTPGKPRIMRSVGLDRPNKGTTEDFNSWANHVHTETVKARFGK